VIDWAEGEQNHSTTDPYIEKSAYIRSIVINGRLYIFSNLSSEAKLGSESCVNVFDKNLRRIFGVDMTKSRPENRPSSVRVNYSLAHFKNKLYLYGGLD
jgi:hypothetical protein